MKLTEITKKPDGTFAGINFDKDTVKDLAAYIKDNNIPNPSDEKELHVTLLYSKKYLPNYKSAGELDTPYEGKFGGFELFDTSSKTKKCLVLRIDCPELCARHKSLMKEHGATYDFDEYKPHVTLSYDFDKDDTKHLPDYKGKLVMDNEYHSDLDLDLDW